MLVSVIIPAYNAENYILRALQSVQNQTHTELEIIVVNDGSNDKTAELVTKLANDDERIILIDSDQNRGVSMSRNIAIRAAKGEWIALLDADDRFLPDRIEKMTEFAVLYELDVVADNMQLRDFDTDAILGLAFPNAWMDESRYMTIQFLLEHDVPGLFRRELGFMKPIIRRAALIGKPIFYAVDICAGEDLLLYAELLSSGFRWRLMKEALYLYSMRKGSVSSSPAANIELVKVNRRLKTLLGDNNPRLWPLFELREVMLNYEILLWYLRNHWFLKAATVATKMPLKYLCARLSAAGLRRIGLNPRHPSEAALHAATRAEA